MKTKPVVMIITFIIMIFLTPIIFSKLMNSKYDTMILKLSQNGYKIEVLKEKIGYLKSERLLDVLIPGDKLGVRNIDYIELKLKTYFKNLPITNVYFDGKVEELKLKKENKFLENFAKGLEFYAVTPNFKKYAFSINPHKYSEENYTLELKKITGNFDLSKKSISFETPIFFFKEFNKSLTLYGWNSFFRKDDVDEIFSLKNHFDVNFSVEGKDSIISNSNLDFLLSFKDSLVKIDADFDKLIFYRLAYADDFFAKIKMYDFNSTLFKEVIKSDDWNLTNKFFANGVKIDLNASLKNLTFLGFNQGGFKIYLKIVFHKAKNVEDFQRNFKKYVSFDIKADLSKNFAKMLANSFTFLRGFLSVPPDKNGIVHINVHIGKGAIK